MRKLLLVESTAAELIPEEFRESWGIKGATIWAELQATPEDFREYEELRIALDDKLEQIRQRADLTTCKTCGVSQIPDTWFGECKRCYDTYDEMQECPNHAGAFDCSPFCELCEGNQEIREAGND